MMMIMMSLHEGEVDIVENNMIMSVPEGESEE